MASGKEHGKVTIALTVPSGILSAVALSGVAEPHIGFIAGCAGCLLGLVIEPDLDQTMITSSEWRVIKGMTIFPIVGHALSAIWVGITVGYALLFGYAGRMFPKGSLPRRLLSHRGISHWPIVGTLTRVGYFGGLLWAAMSLLGVDIGHIVWGDLAGVAVGLCVSDIGHLWRDDGFKLRLRRRRILGLCSSLKKPRAGKRGRFILPFDSE